MKKYSFYSIVTLLFFFSLSVLSAQSLKGMKVPVPPKRVDIKDVEEELDNVFKPEFDTFINATQFKGAWLGSGMTDDDLVILKKYVKKYDISFSKLYRDGSDIPCDSKRSEEKQRFENYNLVLKSPLGKLNIEPFFPKTLGLLDKYADTDHYRMYHKSQFAYGSVACLDCGDDVDPYKKSSFIKGFPVFWTNLIPRLPNYAKELK